MADLQPTMPAFALPAGAAHSVLDAAPPRSPVSPGRTVLASEPGVNPWSTRGLLALIGGLLLWRLLMIPLGVLIPEEAYYWMYAKRLAWGYLDHPPMVAWIIAAGTALFGDTSLGVRFVTWLLSLGSVALCYRLAADWSGRMAGLVAAVVYAITPLFCGTGYVTTPDAPLLFFWMLALVAVTRGYQTGGIAWWLLAGAAVGLGFDSKYPALFLVPGTFLFLVTDRRGRRLLATPGPWLALLAAAALAFPVVWWNAQHDWASFRFQFLRRVAGHGGLSPGDTAAWVGAQFGLLSPLVFVLFTAAWVLALLRFRRDRNGRWRFAACFAVPWLAVCVWHGLFSEVKINWPLPAYLSLLIVVGVLLRWRPRRWRNWSWPRQRVVVWRYALGLALIDALVLLYAAVPLPYLPRPRVLAPWRDLGAATEAFEDRLAAEVGEEPFIIADGKYELASELAFYMRDVPVSEDWKEVTSGFTIVGGGLNYARWHRPEDFLGRHAVYVTPDPSPRELLVLRACFERVGTPQQLFSHPRGLKGRQVYWGIPCYRFLGVPKGITG